MAIFRWDPPYGGVGCRCAGRQNSRLPTSIWLHRTVSTLRPPGVINTVLWDRGKLWHLSRVTVSGGVCWWRETTTRCLRQEASTLRRRQQNSILIVRIWSRSNILTMVECARVIILLKLTTDKTVFATRGLSAIAELLVPYLCNVNKYPNKHRRPKTSPAQLLSRTQCSRPIDKIPFFSRPNKRFPSLSD